MYNIRVCITSKCNYKCQYCRPGGEGLNNDDPDLTKDELLDILSHLGEKIFSSIRITGGEPFARKDIFELLYGIKLLSNYKDISIVTNASLLNESAICEISLYKPISITISLDSLNYEKYNRIVGVNKYETVIKNIKLIRSHGITANINMMVINETKNDLENIILFCQENGLSLKLLDLMNNSADGQWINLYEDMSDIHTYLKMRSSQINTVYYPKKVGIPMTEYIIGKTSVLVKDSRAGTSYAPICLACDQYPCQSGVMPVLAHNGYLKLCNTAYKKGFNILDMRDLKSYDIIYEQLENISYKKLWKP